MSTTGELLPNEGYSKWKLQPLNPKTAALYSEYTRSQVRKNIIPTNIFFFILVMISLVMALKNKEFEKLDKKISPALVHFFLLSGLIVVNIVAFFVSRKYSVAIECITPCYCILVTMFCFPAWIDNPRKPIYIAGQTLLQINGLIYILNAALVFFFSSHYAIASGFRLLLIINNLNLVIRRKTAGDA